MTRTTIPSAMLLGLGLTLAACAEHNPPQANCFTFHETSTQRTSGTATISTMGAEVTEPDRACDFVRLGAGG